MSIKKIIAFAAAAVIAAGICTGVPADIASYPLLTAAAETEDSDFVIETDYAGKKYVSEYKGKGGNIIIPNDVSYIGELAFAGNTTITGVTFLENCYVQYAAFSECTNLKKVTFKKDAEIGQLAFAYCINLEEVAVNGSIKDYIMESAFKACQSLKKVTISKNTHEFGIYDYAFDGCVLLQSINIPDKCTEICPGAFKNCFSLSKLTIPAKTELYSQCCGYATMFTSKNDFSNAKEDDREDDSLTAVADGKTKCCYYNYTGNGLSYNIAEYTPKQLTLTVTKGSSAEEYCIESGIKYIYASSTNTSVPENFKASKTDNSITLSWDNVDGADAYRVYKYNDKTGKYEKYKDVANEKCKVTGLKANTKYKFVVAVYNKVDGKYVKGESSKAVSVTTKK